MSLWREDTTEHSCNGVYGVGMGREGDCRIVCYSGAGRYMLVYGGGGGRDASNGLKKCAHGDEKSGWRGVHVRVFYWNGK